MKSRNSSPAPALPRANTLIDSIAAVGGFGTGQVLARDVTWDGVTFHFHFRDLPGGDVQALLKDHEKGDPGIIAAALCLEDGSPAMDLDQARALKLSLRKAIVDAALEVFGLGATAKAEAKKD